MIKDIAIINGMSPSDVINSLTIDDVVNFIKSLGVENIIQQKEYLILPTICHNSLDEEASMKLYYYDNHKCFHCYTQCGDSMSIFELYIRFMETNGNYVTFGDAVDYVKRFITNGVIMEKHDKINPYIINEDKYEYHDNIIQLPSYDKNVLDAFVKYYPPQWLREGITKEAMDKYNIRFSIPQNKIIIPHYDINDNLIGIRGRALNKEEIEEFGKYRPVFFGKTIYKHPLSYNLYGLNKNKDAIQRFRKAILVEAEKSVLLGDKYMGENNICVAVCGSSINKYQISLLTNLLDVNEIIIAFDRDFKELRTAESKKCRKKVSDLCLKYKNEAIFSYVFDDFGLLKEHDSPLDRGKEIWNKLLNERIQVI